jgi:hypothetical protein
MFGLKSSEPAVKDNSPVKKVRPRKLKSQISGSSIILTVTMGEGLSPLVVEYDASNLSPDMRERLATYGACARLLGSVAGHDGKDAVEAIGRAWQELQDGAWKPRQSKKDKIAVTDLEARINQLPADEQDAARKLFGKLSVSL